jgi:hypothetical protein
LGKQFSGDRDMAMSLQSRARVLVQQCFDTINAAPINGKGSLHRAWRMEDGTVIHAYVQTLGAAPIVRTWIESPVRTTSEFDATSTSFLPFLLGSGWVFGRRPLVGSATIWGEREVGVPQEPPPARYDFVDDWVSANYSDAIGWTTKQVFIGGVVILDLEDDRWNGAFSSVEIAAVARKPEKKIFLQVALIDETRATIKVEHFARGQHITALTFTPNSLSPIRHCSFSPDASKFAVYVPYYREQDVAENDQPDRLYSSEFTLSTQVFDAQGRFLGGGSFSTPTIEKEGTLPGPNMRATGGYLDEEWEAVYSYKWESENTLVPLSVWFTYTFKIQSIEEPVLNTFFFPPRLETCYHTITTIYVGTDFGALLDYQKHVKTPNYYFGLLYAQFGDRNFYEPSAFRWVPMYGKHTCYLMAAGNISDNTEYVLDENGNRMLVDEDGRVVTGKTYAEPADGSATTAKTRLSVDGKIWAEVPYKLRPFMLGEEGPPFQITFDKIYQHVFWPQRQLTALTWQDSADESVPIEDRELLRCMFIQPRQSEYDRLPWIESYPTYPDMYIPSLRQLTPEEMTANENTRPFWIVDVRDLTSHERYEGETSVIRQLVPDRNLNNPPKLVL